MPFKKGQSGNPTGRRRGTPNKATAALRKFTDNFLKKRRKDFEHAWFDLSNKEKVELYLKMLQFSLPKKTEETERLPDDQVQEILNQLFKEDEIRNAKNCK